MTVTFKGQPMTLAGPDLQVGHEAPAFTLVSTDLKPMTLDDVTNGGTRHAMLIVVPSLDTGVCSLESKKFNMRLGELPPDVAAYVVSRDLPFAQGRWAKEQGDINLAMLSDYRDGSFGRAYGVFIEELGLLARSVFIIGKDKSILYKQLVPEVGQEPNYDDAMAAASRTTSPVKA